MLPQQALLERANEETLSWYFIRSWQAVYAKIFKNKDLEMGLKTRVLAGPILLSVPENPGFSNLGKFHDLKKKLLAYEAIIGSISCSEKFLVPMFYFCFNKK